MVKKMSLKEIQSKYLVLKMLTKVDVRALIHHLGIVEFNLTQDNNYPAIVQWREIAQILINSEITNTKDKEK